MDNEVNLNSILKPYIKTVCGASVITVADSISAMREACNQALILAAINAETIEKNVEYTGVRAGGYHTVTVINKSSIIKTKNQII
jgi:hypothetical protein